MEAILFDLQDVSPEGSTRGREHPHKGTSGLELHSRSARAIA